LARLGVLLAGSIIGHWGCATVSLGEPQVERRLTAQSTRQTVPTKRFLSAVEQDGVTATIKVDHACEVVERKTLSVRTHRERRNESAVLDWVLLGGGAVLAAVGAVELADANNVYDTQKDSRAYNPVGPSAARGVGIGLLAAGAALITIPAVDAIRSSGQETTERFEPEKTGRVTSTVACKGIRVDGIALAGRPAGILPASAVVHDGSGEEVDLGAVAAPGAVQLDLASSIKEEWLLKHRADALDILIKRQAAGKVDLKPLRSMFDQRRWTSSNYNGCATPTTTNACDAVRGYLADYPDGAHAADARQLLDDASPKLAWLRESAAWQAADAESCRIPTTEYGCKGVESYLNDYPSGTHAQEATSILKGSAKKIATLKAKSGAEARTAQRKAEAAERAQERKRQAAIRQAAAEAKVAEQKAAQGECPGGRFRIIERGDGCNYDAPSGLVRDAKTGLTWLRVPGASSLNSNQATAAAFCRQANMRLPTKAEAVKLFDDGRDSCAFPCDWYAIWTSTPAGPGQGWVVHDDGRAERKSLNWGNYQACVR
jgi:hypothetical protein